MSVIKIIAAGIAAVSISACGTASQATRSTGPDVSGPVPQGTVGAAGQDGTAPPPPGVPAQLSAVTVTSFRLMRGRPSWAPGEQREIAASSWRFGASASFAWTSVDTADISADLLPVTGRYRATADGITFHGKRTVTSSVGSRTIVVDGTVRHDGSRYQIVMRMTSSWGTGVVVDGQQFAAANMAVNESTVQAVAR